MHLKRSHGGKSAVDVELVGTGDAATVDGSPSEFKGNLGVAVYRIGVKINPRAVAG